MKVNQIMLNHQEIFLNLSHRYFSFIDNTNANSRKNYQLRNSGITVVKIKSI